MTDEVISDKGETATGLSSYISKALMNTLDEDTYFTLPPQTISSLDIFPSASQNNLAGVSSRSDTTIFAVLNKCRTISGQKLLVTWLENPLKSKEKIDLRLDIVQHLVENTELRSLCYDDHLRKIPDLLRISYKVSKEKCKLTDLMKVYNSCKSIQSLCKCYLQVSGLSTIPIPEAVSKLFKWAHTSCDELVDFMTLLEESIEVDSVDENGEYMVKPNSDDDIAKISLEIETLCNQARKQLEEVAADIGLENGRGIKLETDSDKGFGLRVTKNNEAIIRGNDRYEQLSTVKKDGYRFTTRALSKLSAKYVNAKQEYNSLARNVIIDIISKAVMYDSEILEFGMVITLIDVFVSLAVSAVQNNYTRPLILEADAGRITFEGLRHPCVENQPDVENFVPNDISINQEDKKFYVITGPNMGGKSTFIKSVAVGAVMAQCGSMVPAEDARLSVIDGVFTRVGAGDRQMDGISTFMEEMMDMSSILKEATEHSLVIIDELGRGTSTFDGFGLAWSISKHLATVTKCFCLFATHFHELTEMGDEIPTVGNLHVKAHCQADKLTMLFNVVPGICDESYGINVAQYTRFPDHVIQSAKEKLKQFEEVPGFADKVKLREFVRQCVKEFKDGAATC